MRLYDHNTDRGDIDCLPYTDYIDYLADELKRLDLLINLHVLRHQREVVDDSLKQFKGLVISDEEITGLLSASAARTRLFKDEEIPDENEAIIRDALAEIEIEIGKRRNASLNENILLPLPCLSETFHLSPFEEQCLIICLAPELDKRYEKFYGYLHDDITSKYPSIDLILDLMCESFRERINARRAFHQSASLIRYRLLQILDGDREPYSTILSRPLVIDEGIRDFLLGFPMVDGRLEPVARLSAPEVKLDMATLGSEDLSRLRKFVSRHFSGKT